MPELAKYAEQALAQSSLPAISKLIIKNLLKTDVADCSPEDLLRPPSADFRRVWEEDQVHAENIARMREIGEPFGLDETDISQMEFSQALVEEISDRISP